MAAACSWSSRRARCASAATRGTTWSSSTRASRVHARIFGRLGNFVIADQSSNGTFVLIDGSSREMVLRREEAVLGERGWIGLGESAAMHGDHVLRFRLERQKSQ